MDGKERGIKNLRPTRVTGNNDSNEVREANSSSLEQPVRDWNLE